ncbi:MAG: formylglycine-generating enzyme family protein, partial [Afipia sp.]|nr:formylglycine-generating enzyme family protein [Afipia sp.]
MGRTVVTQGQWNAVMGTEPWRGKLRSDQQGVKYPAVYVTGPDAERFCEYLTRLERGQRHIQEDQEFRLPTGSQWEYACRAMSPTRYSFGDDSGQLDDYGWFNRNSGRRLHEVAQKQPNAWGLFDMHGNVQEWCADNDSGPHFDKLTYTSALASNDSDWTFASCYGGYWNSAAIACCCSSTCDFHADYWRNALKGIGFRVVLISCGAHLMRAKKPVKKTRALQATLKKKSAPTQPAKAVALTAAKDEHALSVSERAKIKKLLRTKTLEGVTLGIT